MRFGARSYRVYGSSPKPRGLRDPHAVARMVLPLAAGAVLAPLPLWSGGALASSPVPAPQRIVCAALAREEKAILEAMWDTCLQKDSASPRHVRETQRPIAPHGGMIVPRLGHSFSFENQSYLPHPPRAGCANQMVAPPRLPRSPPD